MHIFLATIVTKVDIKYKSVLRKVQKAQKANVVSEVIVKKGVLCFHVVVIMVR